MEQGVISIIMIIVSVVGDINYFVQVQVPGYILHVSIFNTHLSPERIMEYLFKLVLIQYKRQFQSKPFLKLILKYCTMYCSLKYIGDDTCTTSARAILLWYLLCRSFRQQLLDNTPGPPPNTNHRYNSYYYRY